MNRLAKYLQDHRCIPAAAVPVIALGACSIPGPYVSLPESAPGAARLAIEMPASSPPFETLETRQNFSAEFFRRDVCRPDTIIHRADRSGSKWRTVTREAATPSPAEPAVPGRESVELREFQSVEVGIAAGAPVRLALLGHRRFERDEYVRRVITFRTCPGIVEFTPEAGARYIARYSWDANRCTTRLVRVTVVDGKQSEAQVPVVPACPRGVEPAG